MSSTGWVTVFAGVLVIGGLIRAWVAAIRRFPLDDAVGQWRPPKPLPRSVQPAWPRARSLEARMATIRRNRLSWASESDRLAMTHREVVGTHGVSGTQRAVLGDSGQGLFAPNRYSREWIETTITDVERALQLEPIAVEPAAGTTARWRARRKGSQQAL